MSLSKADVAQALVVMKRFASYLEVDNIAVEAWHGLLEPEVPDADVLREAIYAAFREGDVRDLPQRIIAEAREITGWVPPSSYENVTDQVRAEAKRRALEKAGVTEADFEAHKDDPEWIRAHFPPKQPGAIEA